MAKPFSDRLPILPNGSTTHGNRKKKTIICHNTCSFDAVYQVYAAIYKDSKSIENCINESDCVFDVFIKKSFTKKTLEEVVEERAHLLCSLLEEKVVHCQENTITLDAYMCFNEMMKKLETISKVIYSMEEIKHCKTCNLNIDVKKHTYVPRKFKGDWRIILPNLQKYIYEMNESTDQVCETCFSLLDRETHFAEHVIIDIESCYPDDKIHPFKKDDVSKSITLKNQTYDFKAAVEYKPGHFIAHILRNNNIYETYDGLRSSRIQRTPSEFYSVAFFYGKIRILCLKCSHNNFNFNSVSSVRK